MNDLIIGCSTNYTWDTLKYWVKSIKATQFKGKIVLVLMNCDADTLTRLINEGVEILAFAQDEEKNLVYNPEHNIPVHVDRFMHIHEYLCLHPDFRYVITTDVKDVIFQKNPVEWLEKNLGENNCVFSSESITYENEPWGDKNLVETFGPYIYKKFKKNEIFNVGVLAGKYEAIKALTLNIFVNAINRPIGICDQSTFNFLISQEPYISRNLYSRSEDGWACQLGTTADPSKIEKFRPFLLEPSPKMKDGKVVTSDEKEFTIVHQYDRVPEWKKIIEKQLDN